jgi:hypothetical protein
VHDWEVEMICVFFFEVLYSQRVRLLRVNGLIESQKWLVGFGPSREVIMPDQGVEVWDGEDGVSPSPLSVYLPDMHLDWAKDCEEDEVKLLDI